VSFHGEEIPAMSAEISQFKDMTIWEMEKELIFSTLNKVKGNKTKASEMLGISVRTMRNKLQEYNQKPSE
jgi:two-component system response regulator FlrC